MDRNKVWDVLGINETTNEDEIKQAYRARLIYVNPEDDPEGFMQLRNAYETALQIIREPVYHKLKEEADEQAPEPAKNDVDLWIDKVSNIYYSLEHRRDSCCWKELLNDDICIGLDTNLEAREKLLRFLMDHYYLSHEIWRLIDNCFDITADKEELYEIFPGNFIDYVVYQISYETFFDFSLFKPKSGENADRYINSYYRLKACIDEMKLEACQEIIDELERFETYHPYKDVEKIRYLLLTDNVEKAAELAEYVFAGYNDEPYIITAYALVKSRQMKLDEADELFRKVLAIYPDYYMAKLGLMECLYKKEQYKEAKELAIEILNRNIYDETVNNYLTEINNILLKQYQEEIADNTLSENGRIKLEMAWCLYQNHRFDECIKILEEIPVAIKSEYDFIKLHGLVYFAAGKYDLALDKLLLWLNAILESKNDESEEAQKRYKSLGYAYFSVGECYSNLLNYKEAISYYKSAIDIEANINEKLMFMERLASTYNKAKSFPECIKVCEDIIDINTNYYPAYLLRQEAYFALENDQEVINEYYRAVRIYSGNIQPYKLAIKVFIKHKQYNDAKAVADAAKKAGLDSNEFRLLCIRITRLLPNTKEERIQAIKECMELKGLLQTENNDLEYSEQIDFELAMLYFQEEEYDKAILLIDTLSNTNPTVDFYKLLKAKILRRVNKNQEAITILSSLLEKNPANEEICYEIGRCYYDLNNMERALVYFVRTVKIKEDYIDVYDRIVDIYRYLIDKSKKLEYYNMALPYADKQLEQEKSAYSYNKRGLLHMDAYEFDKALSDFKISLEYSPDDWAIYNNIGFVYMIMRDLDRAIKYLKRSASLITIDKSHLPYLNLARTYYIIRDYDTALMYYEMLYNAYPADIYYIERIADICCSKRDMQNSIIWVNKLRSIESYSKTEIELKLSHIFLLNRDFDNADKHYKLALDSSNILLYLKSSLKYAEFLLITNQYSKSLSLIKKAILKAKGNADNEGFIELFRKAAVIYWSVKFLCKDMPGFRKKIYDRKAGKLANQALALIKKFYLNPEGYCEYPKIRKRHLLDLALIYLTMNDDKKAEGYIQEALKLYPCRRCKFEGCTYAYEIYGMLYEYRGQPDKAAQNYESCLSYDPDNILCMRRMENAKEDIK